MPFAWMHVYWPSYVHFAGWWVPHYTLLPSRKKEFRPCTWILNDSMHIIHSILDLLMLHHYMIQYACGSLFVQITVDADRTVVAFYKFIKKHASIPFQLQKPTSTSKTESGSSDVKESQSSSADLKDELWELNDTSIYEEVWVRRMITEWLDAQQRKEHNDWVRKTIYFPFTLEKWG